MHRVQDVFRCMAGSAIAVKRQQGAMRPPSGLLHSDASGDLVDLAGCR